MSVLEDLSVPSIIFCTHPPKCKLKAITRTKQIHDQHFHGVLLVLIRTTKVCVGIFLSRIITLFGKFSANDLNAMIDDDAFYR